MADALDTRVRLQNLRNFTVQIRDASTDDIVGTGIVVSTDGKIVTCAHVVEAAGVDPRALGSGEVGVYFPQVTGSEKKERSATVAACFANHDDDVVMLQLTGGPAPLGPEQIAVLGSASESQGHHFRSFGYHRLGDKPSGWAIGEILGSVECPDGLCLQAEPVELSSQQINYGMSGSAVLDVERNLVVGVISEFWTDNRSSRDRDTGWAVNGCVLGFDPLGLPLQDQPLPRRTAPQPRFEAGALEPARSARPGIVWNNAPDLLPEWAGRVDMLRDIASDWDNPTRRVTGLIGFGGEGKSSLARKAVDELLERSGAGPDGVFWWGFYDRPSVDEFFEAALKYISGDLIDPREYPSSNAKVHLIGGMLTRGQYLFVLDGLEVLQNQDGDRYDLLRSADMREFLSYFASPYHDSFCLIASRAPTLDLMSYTTYTHRDVDRLSAPDGRELLRNVGVDGPDSALDKVVEDWDGHALTLSLLAGYLVDRHGGDVSHIGEIPPPTADESRYDRVHRVLGRYDSHLSDPEKAFLTIFSAFRLPVGEDAFQSVFRADMGADALNASVAALDDAAFNALLKRLEDYRILRLDKSEQKYTVHPLIHAHYSQRLKDESEPKRQALHRRIEDYYLKIANKPPRYWTLGFPTLNDLKLYIEAVYHACQGGRHDEAYAIWEGHIDQWDSEVRSNWLQWQRNWLPTLLVGGIEVVRTPRAVLTSVLGAYEANLALSSEFFPDGDTSDEPLVSLATHKSFILNEVGFSLMNLGRLGEASHFYERANQIKITLLRDWPNVSVGYLNLVDVYMHRGMLPTAKKAVNEALKSARKGGDGARHLDAIAALAWSSHLCGNVHTALIQFSHAEAQERELDKTKRYLYGLRGIRHADSLHKAGNLALSRTITEVNLEICQRNRWTDNVSLCRRVLGDLDTADHDIVNAILRYDEAVRVARRTSVRAVLIEALLARGRLHARHMQDPSAAFSDLDEAFEYAASGGYRIYEADIRIALAWAHIAANDPAKAQTEAQRAKQMSEEMGYHWGKLDANEVLNTL